MTESDQQSSEMSTRVLLLLLVMSLFWLHQLALDLREAQAISWLSVGGGIFISTSVFIEAVSNTRPVQYIDEWLWQFGEWGRALTLVLLVVVVSLGGIWLYRDSLVPLQSFYCGVLSGAIVRGLIEIVRRGFSN